MKYKLSHYLSSEKPLSLLPASHTEEYLFKL